MWNMGGGTKACEERGDGTACGILGGGMTACGNTGEVCEQ